MRPGEWLGLQWGDLDWTAKRLHVRRTVYKGTFYKPKTKRSKRGIDIGDQLLGVLSRWRRERYGEVVPTDDALMFPGANGGPLDLDHLRRRVWTPALAKAGLRYVRPYSLRHTFASMLIQQGENIVYVSRQLGHTSTKMTLDVYAHCFPDEKRTAATRLEAQLTTAVPSSSHPAEPAEPCRNTPNTVEDGAGLSARLD